MIILLFFVLTDSKHGLLMTILTLVDKTFSLDQVHFERDNLVVVSCTSQIQHCGGPAIFYLTHSELKKLRV